MATTGRRLTDEEYATATAEINAAQRAYDEAARRYRAREIGDAEYLAAKQALAAANHAYDVTRGEAATEES